MKKNLFLAAILATGLMTSSVKVFADDGTNGPDDGNIQGSETIQAEILLMGTSNAPSGAAGMAHLEAENEDGSLTANLSIFTQGLDAGIYTVSAIRQSDGSNVVIGNFMVGGSGDGEDDDSEQHWGGGISWTNGLTWSNSTCWSNGSVTLSWTNGSSWGDGGGDGGSDGGGSGTNGFSSHSEFSLPGGLDPVDIAELVISDTNGNAILTGDVTNLTAGSSMTFQASIQVGPGEGAPNAGGLAEARSIFTKGKHSNQFTLVASDVPPNTKFAVHVNGKRVAAVKSNHKGNVMIKKLSLNLWTVHSVQLLDAQNRVAAKAKF